MADSDPEVGVGDAEGTFDFDVTKDHGLSSDSEEEEEDEDTGETVLWLVMSEHEHILWCTMNTVISVTFKMT